MKSAADPVNFLFKHSEIFFRHQKFSSCTGADKGHFQFLIDQKIRGFKKVYRHIGQPFPETAEKFSSRLERRRGNGHVIECEHSPVNRRSTPRYVCVMNCRR